MIPPWLSTAATVAAALAPFLYWVVKRMVGEASASSSKELGDKLDKSLTTIVEKIGSIKETVTKVETVAAGATSQIACAHKHAKLDVEFANLRLVLQKELKDHADRIEARLADLPSKGAVKGFFERANRLEEEVKETKLAAATEQALRGQFVTDVDSIRKAVGALVEKVGSVDDSVKRLHLKENEE